MTIEPFKLERYFARYEFNTRYLLSSSDCESLSLGELLAMASPEGQGLWQELRLGYTESPGHSRLREEAAGLYERISPENVLIAAPEEAIFIAMHSLLSAGDQAVVISPSFQSLYEVPRLIGCRVDFWRLQAGEAGWELDLEALRGLVTAETRLIVVNFPHNPTGHTLKLDELEAVIELARRYGIPVFSDEMYRLLELDPAVRLPAVCDLYEKGISLSGLSKAFALPGLRLGWLAAQDDGLLARCLSFKDHTTICSSAPSEVLGIIALQNRERILERSREIVRRNLSLAEGFFGNRPEQFGWLAPKAGSVAFPKWRGAGSLRDFCAGLLERQGVMIVPGELFDFPGEHFRVGLGRLNFGEGLERVGVFLEG